MTNYNHGILDPGGQPDIGLRHPLEIGLFAWNVRGGLTASAAVLDDLPSLRDYWVWSSASELIKLAEEAGFDYQVPLGRWLGMGGTTGYLDSSLECVTASAALAPITKRLRLFSTVHVTYRLHPLQLAKSIATIDHISGGRAGVNIVSGWSAAEMAAFGITEKIPHDEAYVLADEFTTLLKLLWYSSEPVDFEGKYFQTRGAIVSPRPTQSPRPILMSAGNSEIGLDFASRQADWAFITAPTLDGYREKVSTVRRISESHGRRVRIAAVVYAIPDVTDARAQATADRIAEQVDRVATTNFIAGLRGMSYGKEFLNGDADQDTWSGVGKDQFLHIAMGIGAWWAIGSFETVADRLRELYEIGIESVLFGFFEPLKGIKQVGEHVIPLLREAGLRG